jgi:hypothetical protein
MRKNTWLGILAITISILLFGNQAAFAGCQVLPGGDTLVDELISGSWGVVKGTVAIKYEAIEGNPFGYPADLEGACILGTTSMHVSARLKLIVKGQGKNGKDLKGGFTAVSGYFPYAKLLDEGSVEYICFDNQLVQKKLLLEWADENVIPSLLDSLNVDRQPNDQIDLPEVLIGLMERKKVVQSEIGGNPQPFAHPSAMFDLVVGIDEK